MDTNSTNWLPRAFSKACDGTLSPAEHEQLDQLLREDAEARCEYAKFCQLQADLHFHVRARRAGKKIAAVVALQQESAPGQILPLGPSPGQSSPGQSSPGPSLPAEWSMGVIFFAGAITASLAAVLILWLGSRPELESVRQPTHARRADVAQADPAVSNAAAPQSDSPATRSASSATQPSSTAKQAGSTAKQPGSTSAQGCVARIVRVSSDFSWSHPAAPDFLLRVKSGDKLDVASGLVQLEFASGAKIILHGPAVFTPTSITAGKLESGRLTGEVSEGNFQLTTPAAEVNDLGTEFGVCVDSEKSTDVVVFNGKVQVIDTLGSRETLDMTQGMSARIRSDGSKLFGGETTVDQFARFVPVNTLGQDKNELSVVDVLCGGDGFNTSLSGAADPLSGKIDHGEQKPGIRKSNGVYHPVDWNPIIDGVFMPAKSGGRTICDSLGGVVELPKNNGLTWGPIWARRWESALKDAGATADFWGTKTLKNISQRLKDAQFGILGMCPNVGVTLDLRAVRLLQQRDPLEFRGVVANLDNAERDYPHDAKGRKRTADIRVFVDGELRYQRLAFRLVDGDASIRVKLAAEDRFLTIVSTDSDGDTSYDHVVLIDPVIVLEPTKRGAVESVAAPPQIHEHDAGLLLSMATSPRRPVGRTSSNPFNFSFSRSWNSNLR